MNAMSPPNKKPFVSDDERKRRARMRGAQATRTRMVVMRNKRLIDKELQETGAGMNPAFSTSDDARNKARVALMASREAASAALSMLPPLNVTLHPHDHALGQMLSGAVLMATGGLQLGKREPRGCRWIDGDVRGSRGAWAYCQCNVTPGSVYCDVHEKRSYPGGRPDPMTRHLPKAARRFGVKS